MKAPHLSFNIIVIALSLSIPVNSAKRVNTTQFRTTNESNTRRILHQPLFPATSAPPPQPPQTPPSPHGGTIPFFHEYPAGPAPSSSSKNAIPIPTETQPTNVLKKVPIAISVGIVTLGMLSSLAFFLYNHRAKHPSGIQKLVDGNNIQRNPENSTAPQSRFLYIGTVEPRSPTLNEARLRARRIALWVLHAGFLETPLRSPPLTETAESSLVSEV